VENDGRKRAEMSLLGYQWLIEEYGLPRQPLPVASEVGTRMMVQTWPDGNESRTYSAQYRPAENNLAGHLEFAMKHEGTHLAVLADLFETCGPALIEAMVEDKPTGRYARLAGFYYEWLTGRELSISATVSGNYVDALDAKQYWTADKGARVPRWRVRDNLLGDNRFCPVVRRTDALKEALAVPLEEELVQLVADFPPKLFARAGDYLYLKETRSTYGIEHESMPQSTRLERFVELLREAGKGRVSELMSEESLRQRQNLIVDPRYAVKGYRNTQSYVGEQRPDFTQRVHYICPPPEWIAEMMEGLAATAERSEALPPVVRAAAIAFGFVFIHPFEDGTGRLHRFLIHDILHRGGMAKAGLMLPVSATMLRLMGEYNSTLENYSRPLLLDLAEYSVDDAGRLKLLNARRTSSYFRYPDLTAQCEYLSRTVAITIREDVAEELRFLRNYDRARLAVQDIVDMPDRRRDILLRMLHQNNGTLLKKKRPTFSELSDEEIERIEAAFAEAFRMDEGR
jgi:hypothetical protein